MGYVLYEKTLPKSATIPSTLRIPEFRDRAYIYVNNVIGFELSPQLTRYFKRQILISEIDQCFDS